MAPRKATAPVVTLTERFDYGALKYIVENLPDLKGQLNKTDEELAAISAHLQKYMAHANQDGTITVNYTYANDVPGRLFAQNGLSLQSMCKVIRNTIACNQYTDVDFVNCHPNILLQFCQKHNIPAPKLEEYCKNRDQVLNSISHVVDDPKTSILAIMNGGKGVVQRSNNLSNNYQWIQSFENEMRDIREAIIPYAPDEFKLAKARKNHNVLGSMVNMLYARLRTLSF